jgi:hypothetical protein
MTQPMIHIFKEGSCNSNSGKAHLNFCWGYDDREEIYSRINSSSGAGYFSSEWVPLNSIIDLLNDSEGPITGETLQPYFKGRSINTAYFLLAVLNEVGLVQRWRRAYKLTNVENFRSEMKALVVQAKKKTIDVDLDAPKTTRKTKPKTAKGRAEKVA